MDMSCTELDSLIQTLVIRKAGREIVSLAYIQSPPVSIFQLVAEYVQA